MKISPEQFEIWKFVLATSTSISSDLEKGPVSNLDLVQALNTIEEVCQTTMDPIQDLQGYVLLDLCRTIRKALVKNSEAK